MTNVLKMDPAVPKVRIQLDLNPQEIETLNRLMVVCGIETRKDLFNNALTLFEWAVEEVRQGRAIGSFERGTREFTVLNMPAFSRAAKQAGTGERLTRGQPIDSKGKAASEKVAKRKLELEALR